jgi:hypothetical protein
VALFFDRTARADTVRAEAKIRAERIMREAETMAGGLETEADQAVARLRALGEPVVEIATMTDQPVSQIRAALARAAREPVPAPPDSDATGSPLVADASTVAQETSEDLPTTGTERRVSAAGEHGSDADGPAA